MVRIAPLLLAAPIIYFFWFHKSEDLEKSLRKPQGESSILVGQAVPDFSFPKEQNSRGEKFSIGDLRGKGVLVHFWATWCGPCIVELPELIRLARTRKNLQVVAISVDRDWPTIYKFFARYPHLKDLQKETLLLIDPKGDTPALFGTMGLPESFLLRSDLVVDTKLVGPQSWFSGRLAPLLDRLSAEHR